MWNIWINLEGSFLGANHSKSTFVWGSGCQFQSCNSTATHRPKLYVIIPIYKLKKETQHWRCTIIMSFSGGEKRRFKSTFHTCSRFEAENLPGEQNQRNGEQKKLACLINVIGLFVHWLLPLPPLYSSNTALWLFTATVRTDRRRLWAHLLLSGSQMNKCEFHAANFLTGSTACVYRVYND